MIYPDAVSVRVDLLHLWLKDASCEDSPHSLVA